MSILDELTTELIAFRDARNWAKFHSVDNLAKSVCIEAAELLECFQWQVGVTANVTANVGDEIADVAIYLLTLCHELDFDLAELIRAKVAKNGEKYPV